jgi:hypothetical protein
MPESMRTDCVNRQKRKLFPMEHARQSSDVDTNSDQHRVWRFSTTPRDVRRAGENHYHRKRLSLVVHRVGFRKAPCQSRADARGTLRAIRDSAAATRLTVFLAQRCMWSSPRAAVSDTQERNRPTQLRSRRLRLGRPLPFPTAARNTDGNPPETASIEVMSLRHRSSTDAKVRACNAIA